jgi:hypothetical protein
VPGFCERASVQATAHSREAASTDYVSYATCLLVDLMRLARLSRLSDATARFTRISGRGMSQPLRTHPLITLTLVRVTTA